MAEYNQASKVVALRTNDNFQHNVDYVFVKQFDANSRFVHVEIWDENGKVPISGTPKLNLVRPDGTHVCVIGIVSADDRAIVKLSSEAMECPGLCPCDLSIVAPYADASENFEGDGETRAFVSEGKLHDITAVEVNGEAVATGWSYSDATYTLSFSTAPNAGDVIVLKGTGTQVLTSSTFYVIVEESNYSVERS